LALAAPGQFKTHDLSAYKYSRCDNEQTWSNRDMVVVESNIVSKLSFSVITYDTHTLLFNTLAYVYTSSRHK